MWNPFKKERPILRQEDIEELDAIKREAYMEEARKIVKESARQKAKEELSNTGGFSL